jgi:hypothetical protein
MARKPGGGEAPSKSLTFGDLNELAEQLVDFGLGFATGALPGLTRGIVGALFDKRDLGSKAEKNDRVDIKKALGSEVLKGGGDEKIKELTEKCYQDLVINRASGKNDAEKERDAQQILKDFKTAVTEYRFQQSQRTFDAVVNKLTDEQRNVFSSWLNNSLTKEQRQQIMDRKKFITSPDTIIATINIGLRQMGITTISELYVRWGYVETHADWRAAWSRASQAMFDHLMTVLPKVPIKDQLGSVVEAVFTGKVGEHPTVRAVEKSLKDNAAERIKHVEDKRNKFKGRNSL